MTIVLIILILFIAALGVALYMTGNREEAISCFRAAAAAGNQQAKENLKQLKVEN